MTSLLFALVYAVLAAAAPAQPDEPATVTPPATQAARFAMVDVRIDPKNQPLAAYQVEVIADSSNVKLAGIEGGDHPAFRDPPYYDPAALNQNRVILAAFNTGSDLPAKEFRAARLHVMISGDHSPKWEVKLVVASAADGTPLRGATASVSSLPSEGAAP